MNNQEPLDNVSDYYCAKCRAKELELYNKVLNTGGLKHIEAIKLAKCKHPTGLEI